MGIFLFCAHTHTHTHTHTHISYAPTSILPNSVSTSSPWLIFFFCSCSCLVIWEAKKKNKKSLKKNKYLETSMYSTANNCLNTHLHVIVFSTLLWHYYSSSSSKLAWRGAGEANLFSETKEEQRKRKARKKKGEMWLIKLDRAWLEGGYRGKKCGKTGSEGRGGVGVGRRGRIFNCISGHRNQSPGAQPNQTCPNRWGASAETSSDLWTSTSPCLEEVEESQLPLFGLHSPEGRLF